MNNNERLIDLLEQVRKGAARAAQYSAIRELIEGDESGELIGQLHAFHTAQLDDPKPYDFPYWQEAVKEILAVDKMQGILKQESSITEVRPVHRMRLIKHWGWWAAAAIFLLLGTGVYRWLRISHKAQEIATKASRNDVLPGTNSAVLTLAGGEQVVLDSAASGILGKQGQTTIRNDKGLLSYTALKEKPTEILYNTLTTRRGNQYQLVLPDGSKVWLNAASSITYPTAFAGKERSVTITGEAYFEVAKNPAMPFRVKVNNMQVEVLGTHFNINAYTEEPTIKTTLLEGTVRVHEGALSKIMIPGQQAQVTGEGQINLLDHADLDQAVAWKNGLFDFNHAALPVVMRQLSRWYDVDVVYEGNIPAQEFGGKMQRDLRLSQVLKILGEMEVHFRIEGKKLIVMP